MKKRLMGNCFNWGYISLVDRMHLVRSAFITNDLVELSHYIGRVDIWDIGIAGLLNENTHLATLIYCVNCGYDVKKDPDILRKSFTVSDIEVFNYIIGAGI